MTLDFHRRVCEYRQSATHRRNLYLLARDHLKTSLLTVAGNVQRILNNPSIRILLASNKAETAEGMLAEIKGHLMDDKLVWAFPDILWADPSRTAEEWTRSAISVKRQKVTKEATIETIGVEGASTGKHYDHGSFDDLVDEHNSKTRNLLETTINWYVTSQSLFEPQATQEIVGTPWEFGDLYDWLIQQMLKRRLHLGVYRQPCWALKEPGVLRLDTRGGIAEDEFVYDDHGLVPAYGVKHTQASLEDRQRIDPRVFAAQWLLRPVDDASALFPRSKAVIVPRSKIPDPATLWCVMAVDPAISMEVWADYSAIAVIGFGPDGLAYVLDLRRGKWPESELIRQVYESYNRIPGIRVIGFEAVGFQKLYFREFARAGETRGFLPIMKLERDNRVGKAVRIRALEPLWTAKQLVLADDLLSLDDFLEEAERFRPWKESVHDDMLDALADCLQLRVRPSVQDPDEGYDDETAARRRFERSHPGMDRTSLRNAYQMAKRREIWQESREAEALGIGQMDEFLAG